MSAASTDVHQMRGRPRTAGQQVESLRDRARGLRPLSQVEIETNLAAAVADYETATEVFAEDCRRVAECEGDFKLARYSRLLNKAGQSMTPQGGKVTEAIREADSYVSAQVQYRAYLIAREQKEATKAKMEQCQGQVSALQTLLRSVAAQA